MEWSGGFTELPIDPVLEKNMPLHVQFQSWRAFFFFWLQVHPLLTS